MRNAEELERCVKDYCDPEIGNACTPCMNKKRLDEIRGLSVKERYFYWITERENIRLAREKGKPKPWTECPILRTYKFCNVRRMDDRVSVWLMKNWYRPFKDHHNILKAVTLARQLNNTSSLYEVGFPIVWDPFQTEGVLNKRVKEGKTNFAAAYMITGTLGGTKIQQIVHKVVDPLPDYDEVVDTDSMELTWKNLMPFKGFSSFIAGQVTADLRWAMSGRWKDRMSWAPMGPGSRRGMNRLAAIHPGTPMAQKDFRVKFPRVLELVFNEVPSSISGRLEAMDVQNTLCEFDKFERTLWGEGRPKQKYPGV